MIRTKLLADRSYLQPWTSLDSPLKHSTRLRIGIASRSMSTGPPQPGLLQRTWMAAVAGLTALNDPKRADMVARFGDVTSPFFLERIRDKMLLDPVGRKILRERPVLSSHTIDLNKLSQLPRGLFGREYVEFINMYKITPDSRNKAMFIDNVELAYVLDRYRQVHDFWHVFAGLPITTCSEIALKLFEYVHIGLPVAGVGAFLGPVILSSQERSLLLEVYSPWAIQCASNCKYLMNVYYEDMFERDLDQLRKELCFIPSPVIK